MIRFSHAIYYVKDIEKAIDFYKKAFGIELKFAHESGLYAELNTGESTLAFVHDELAHENLPEGFIAHDLATPPVASEIVFTVDNVTEAYKKAVQAGAVEVAVPQEKPWGQVVGYIRDPNGVLIEIASVI